MKIIFFVFLVFISFVHFSFCEVPIEYLNGIDELFKKKTQSCSPLEGKLALSNNLIKNVRFNSFHIQNDPRVKFVIKLFESPDGVNLIQTRKGKEKDIDYLDIETIGIIMNFLATLPKETINNKIEQTRHADMLCILISKNVDITAEETEEVISKLQQLENKSYSRNRINCMKVPKKNGFVGSCGKSNSFILNLAQEILGLYQFQNSDKEFLTKSTLLPDNMLEKTLLSFLWTKLDTEYEIKMYLEKVRPNCLKRNAVFSTHITKSYSEDDLFNINSKIQMHQSITAGEALYAYKSNLDIYPFIPIPYASSGTSSLSYGDCVETALRNTIANYLHNSKRDKIDINILDKMVSKNPNVKLIKEHFKKFPLEQMNTNAARVDWANTIAQIFNDPKYIMFLTKKLFHKTNPPQEIRSNYQNFFTIMALFFDDLDKSESLFGLLKKPSSHEQKEQLVNRLNSLFSVGTTTWGWKSLVDEIDASSEEEMSVTFIKNGKTSCTLTIEDYHSYLEPSEEKKSVLNKEDIASDSLLATLAPSEDLIHKNPLLLWNYFPLPKENWLITALKHNNVELFKNLIKLPEITSIIKNETTINGKVFESLFIYAISNNLNEIAKILLKHQNFDITPTELKQIFKSDNYELFKFLVDQSKIDINDQIIYAVKKNSKKIAFELIKNPKIDINQWSKDLSLFHLAWEFNHIDIFKYLLKQDRLIYWNDSIGLNSILDWIFRTATEYEYRAEVLKILLEKEDFKDHLDVLSDRNKTKILNLINNGNTQLQIAFKSKDYKKMKLLLEEGEDPNTLNGLGETILDLVLEREDLFALEILLKHPKLKLNKISKTSKMPPISYVIARAQNHQVEMIQMLLSTHKIDCGTLDGSGNSPLKVARNKNNEKAVAMLLEYGCNPNFDNNSYYDPSLDPYYGAY